MLGAVETSDVDRDGQGFFVTVRAGTAYRHLFSKVKKKLFVMYIIKECDFRLVSTGTYYLVPAPIFVQKNPGFYRSRSRLPIPKPGKVR